MTTEPRSVKTGEVISKTVKSKIDDMKKDIESLKQQVMIEREKYQKSANSDTAISAVIKFHVNDKFILNATDANYLLSIEIQSPIENVLLQVCLSLNVNAKILAL